MSGLSRKQVRVRTKKGKVYQRSMMVKSSGKMSALEFTKRHGAKFLLGGVATGSAGAAGLAAGWRAGTSLPMSHTKRGVAGATLGVVGAFASHAMAARGLVKAARHSQMQKDWARSTPSAKLAAGALYLGGVTGSILVGRKLFEHSEERRAERRRNSNGWSNT